MSALPNYLISHILSYGDPDVTMKYKAVINQINYYIKEYKYLSHKQTNQYYNRCKYDLLHFMFTRCYYKIQARYKICKYQTHTNLKINENIYNENMNTNIINHLYLDDN